MKIVQLSRLCFPHSEDSNCGVSSETPVLIFRFLELLHKRS